MTCPECGEPKLLVLPSAHRLPATAEYYLRTRKRRCTACGAVFWTAELAVSDKALDVLLALCEAAVKLGPMEENGPPGAEADPDGGGPQAIPAGRGRAHGE